MNKKSKTLLLTLISAISLYGCNKTVTSETPTSEPKSESSVETTSKEEIIPSEEMSSVVEDVSSEEVYPEVDLSYRTARNFEKYSAPTNQTNENELPLISNRNYKIVDIVGNRALVSKDVRLEFVLDQEKYYPQLVSIKTINETAIASNQEIMFTNKKPVIIYLRGSNETIETRYDSITNTDYGIKAIANITSNAGSVLEVMDCYYFASENEDGAFNFRRTIKVIEAADADTGFASQVTYKDENNNSMEYFVPNNVFKTARESKRNYKETYLGLPMMMERNCANGNTLSISRYQPIIHYEQDSFASLAYDTTSRELTINYPAVDGNRKYHPMSDQLVFDITVRAEVTNNYEEASSSVYNAHFNLQNQRIVDTDIDEVYRVINEDYKTFLQVTEQEDKETKKKYTSYGLPWRITIEDGEIGPKTYQAGFIGQQMPSAYNMMLYGVRNNDLESLQNGINVLDFWVDGAEFMSVAGVPHIWYDTWSDGFRAYPCFIRMAVDAMEGMLDAYRLALAHGIYKENWENAIYAFADFLVNCQNEDGSYYRCYNYAGGPFVSWDDGIEEPPGNICQSYSKSCSAMPIRFLGKMYELSEDESYKQAALNAGDYVYNNLYRQGYYQGGTCDGPNNIDKEAGVFATYAYDTLYTLTKDEKWLTCLRQAAAFTMSTAVAYSYAVKNSTLKSAYPLTAGYTDGLSFITCGSIGVDNYIAYFYYELFRIYIYTGDVSYLKQAEFIQQNTKSIMNWDGQLGYKYKSLVPEASTTANFSYGSVSDGAWVTWSSVANVEPISKMYNTFGCADVAIVKEKSLDSLRSILEQTGVGGKDHKIYQNNIVDKIN